MTLQQADIDYFNLGQHENPRYWERLGGRPDFKDAFVIDVGCGHGSLCVDIAQSGARRVVGLDLNSRLIDFANENLRCNYPQFADMMAFRYQDLQEAPDSEVDYFVSKDTFEHIIEPALVLAEMKKRLRPGGRVYAGFGPLWNSPFGDHRRTRFPIPWMHAVLSERFLVNWHNRHDPKQVNSIHDLGLNGLPLREYQRIFRSCGMNIVFWKINASKSPVSQLFSLIGRVPFLTEYCAHNIYCVLEKREP
ncbi:MAG: class I SAM-dependent methyltransferase [Anaerolineae bacterium]|nr:class I SAM-dependent methyltransferase [Anaerolineae bacterium]